MWVADEASESCRRFVGGLLINIFFGAEMVHVGLVVGTS